MHNSVKTGRVRQALRKATMASHQRVDTLFAHFAFDSVADYAAFLSAHARALAPLEAAAGPDLPRLPLLAADLRALGQDLPDPLPLPIEDGEAFRWGLRYALEGSRLGGAMLARQVKPGLPHAYLSATHEQGGWAAFQARLDAAAGDDDGFIDAAVRGAEAAFDLFAAAGEAQKPLARG